MYNEVLCLEWCCMCKKKLLFIVSLLARSGTWFSFYLDSHGSCLSNILELFHYWKTQGPGHSKETIWKVILALLRWSIWREISRYLFEDRESNVLRLKSSFLRFLLDWALTYVPIFSSSNLVG